MGLIQAQRSEQIALLDSVHYEFVQEQFEKQARRVDYKISAGHLTRRWLYNSRPNEADQFLEIEAEKTPAKSAQACLPPVIEVSAKAYFQHYRVLDLVREDIRQRLGYGLAHKLLESLRGDGKIPDGALSEADEAKLLRAFDVVLKKLWLVFEPEYLTLADEVEKTFLRSGHCSHAIDPQLASPEKQKWAAEAATDVMRSYAVSGYMPLLEYLNAPAWQSVRVAPASLSGGRALDQHNGLADDYQEQRAFMLKLADNPLLVRVLPFGAQLESWRAASGALEDKAKALRATHVSCLERGVYFTGGEILGKFYERFANRQDSKAHQQQYDEDVSLLKERLLLSLNPQVTGRCQKIASLFTPDSLPAKNFQWSAVRLASGKPLTPPDWQASQLHSYYALGCQGIRDTKTARQILQTWAKTQEPGASRSRRAASCELVDWLNFGIGGPVEKSQAAQWAAQYQREAGFALDCGARQLRADPADPWRGAF